jgi:UMF1 family MFS transporter
MFCYETSAWCDTLLLYRENVVTDKRAVVGWVIYDFAAVIFAMNIAGLYFPLWVVEDADGRDAHVAIALSAAMAIILVAAPILGSFADRSGRRVLMLGITTLACVFSTALLGHGGLIVSLAIFALANALNGCGLVFYDALLPVVSTEETRGRVSGYGIAAGFGGAVLGVGIGALILAGDAGAKPLVFKVTAAMFLLAALPCLFWVRDPATTEREPRPPLVQDLRLTLALCRGLPGVSRFLLGRVLYTDAANTIFAFMSVYSVKEVGFSEAKTQFVLLLGILGGPIGALLAGRAADHAGPRASLRRILWLWVGVLTLCAAIPALGLPDNLFWIVAPLGGVAFGGTSAADRALLLALTPVEHAGRFFGVFAMTGRFSAIIGPLLWALTVDLLDLGRPAAVLTLAVLVLATLYVYRVLPPGAASGQSIRDGRVGVGDLAGLATES